MNTPIEITAPSSTMTPSTISERAPMKQLSSMMVGFACNGSSTPPRPAPPDRCPCVDHRTFTNVRTDVDVGRHEDGVRRDERATPHDGMRHDAHTVGAE